ncbi:MAG TPA: TnpV protein [Ruminococcus sp.]
MKNITYRQVGDFNIPNLILPPEEANIRLGKWGMMHKDYLEKHKTALFNSLIIQGKLYQHCAEIEKQARVTFDTLVEQMKEREGVSEQLKDKNRLEWVCRMQNIEARVRELIRYELIFNYSCFSAQRYLYNLMIRKANALLLSTITLSFISLTS